MSELVVDGGGKKEGNTTLRIKERKPEMKRKSGTHTQLEIDWLQKTKAE